MEKWIKIIWFHFLKIMLDFTLSVLFWRKGFVFFHGQDILNPLLWAKIKCLWEADYGLDLFVIHANLSETLIELCHKKWVRISLFIYSLSIYNFYIFSTFYNGGDWKKELPHLKSNRVLQVACVTALELTIPIILIFVLIFVAFTILMFIISVVVYCCVCCKDGCCKCTLL